MDAAPTVAVVGAGAWGTTLATILGKREPVLLVTHRQEVADEINATHRNERRLPGIDLPEALTAAADPRALSEAADLVIFAVPSSHLRAVAAQV
ncbi:MAG TPA: NAD(P)-binding domain-containing protein, partial [Candidatus Limnocylindrales bacterium]